ncbi:hypothetical protein MNBD_GAMMA07-725 [hydrothermal vent metagenome]|uniref:MerR family transcriptional regulator n=1 Tax=hydrothermal vent metagenome TaxID=652676 RepID=A0A3B0X231_9ZZZZ
MKENHINQPILNGLLLDEHAELTLNELCCACSSTAEWIIELVEEGVLEPKFLAAEIQKTPNSKQTQWRFSGQNLVRAQIAKRLECDLNINLAGIALALELLDEIDVLTSKLLQN